MFWALGMYLALELAVGCVAAQVLNKTADELAGPYVAFAVPCAILAPLVWWLKKWEEQGASPKPEVSARQPAPTLASPWLRPASTLNDRSVSAPGN